MFSFNTERVISKLESNQILSADWWFLNWNVGYVNTVPDNCSAQRWFVTPIQWNIQCIANFFNLLFSQKSRATKIKKWVFRPKVYYSTVGKLRCANLSTPQQSKIKSSLYSRYGEGFNFNEWRCSSPLLTAWATELRKSVTAVASRWRHCVRTDSNPRLPPLIGMS